MKSGVLFLIFLALSAYKSHGQGIGAELGFNMNSLGAKVANTSKTENFLKPGFRAGIVHDIGISQHMGYQYGVFYSAKGGFISYDRLYEEEGQMVKQDFSGYLRVDYVEVPVSILYRSNKRNGGYFFTGGGIYLAGAFGGIVGYEKNETISNQKRSTISVLLPFSTGSDEAEDAVKIFDAGLQGQAGYELHSGFYARVYGAYGLLNISPSPDVDMRNINFGMSVGYMLR